MASTSAAAAAAVAIIAQRIPLSFIGTTLISVAHTSATYTIGPLVQTSPCESILKEVNVLWKLSTIESQIDLIHATLVNQKLSSDITAVSSLTNDHMIVPDFYPSPVQKVQDIIDLDLNQTQIFDNNYYHCVSKAIQNVQIALKDVMMKRKRIDIEIHSHKQKYLCLWRTFDCKDKVDELRISLQCMKQHFENLFLVWRSGSTTTSPNLLPTNNNDKKTLADENFI